MKAHRTEATVGGDGSVTVTGLPFLEGENVEVIVLPVAGPPSSQQPQRKAGSMKGIITISDDFDDPLEDFEPYM